MNTRNAVAEINAALNFLKAVALGEYSETLIRERAGLLADRLAMLRERGWAENTWIPVEENEPPKDGSEFIGLYAQQMNVKQLISWNKIHKHWQSKGKPIYILQITHWMPIAAPPEGKVNHE